MEVLKGREPLYRAAAQIIVDTAQQEVPQVVQKILAALKIKEGPATLAGNTSVRSFGSPLGRIPRSGPGRGNRRLPAPAAVGPEDVQRELDRRRPGVQAHATKRREPDEVEILSGVFEGHTTGTPISLVVYNRDVKSQDYDALREVFRPGHGDLSFQAKYGIRDHRGGGRASAGRP